MLVFGDARTTTGSISRRRSDSEDDGDVSGDESDDSFDSEDEDPNENVELLCLSDKRQTSKIEHLYENVDHIYENTRF